MGFGRVSKELANKGAMVTGIDINPDMLTMAKEYCPNVLSCYGDIENIPFEDAQYDCAICLEALMHVGQPSKAIAEMSRVVKRGGLVIFTINNRWSLPYLVSIMQPHSEVLRRIRKKPVIHYTHSKGEAIKWIDDAGLVVDRIYGFGLIYPKLHVALCRYMQFNLLPEQIGLKIVNWERKYNLKESRYLFPIMKCQMFIARKGE